MRLHLKLALECFPDSFHRRSNDLWRALAKSGMATWSLLAMLTCNIAYGPWQKGKNFNEMTELAHEVSVASTPDDPILIRLWPRILRDKGVVDMQADARAERESFLQGLLASSPARVKGPKTAPSRFFSINHGWRFWRTSLHTRCFCLVHLAKEKGWRNNWEDLFTTSASLKACVAPDGPSASVASSSTAPPPPIQSVTEAKTKMQALLRKSHNALHAVCRILCDAEFVTNMDMTVEPTRPLEDEHNHYARTLKDSDSIKACFTDMAQGGWQSPLRAIVDMLGQLSTLRACGFQTEFPEEARSVLSIDIPEIVAEDALAVQAWALVLNLLSERCWSMSPHMFACPELIAPINSNMADEVQTALQKWRRPWEAYAAARQQKSSKLEGMCARSPLNSRSMEACSRFARNANWELEENVSEIGHALFGHFGHSLMCERANQRIRDAEGRDSASSSVACWKSWSVPIVGKFLESHGRSEVAPTMDMPAPRVDSSAFFRPSNEDAKDLRFASVMDEKTWASLDAMGRRRLAAEVEPLRFLHEHRCWHKVDDVWRSALLPRHQVVLQKNDLGRFATIFMVLAVTEFGALTWPVHRLGCDNNRSFALGSAGASCSWVPIFSLERVFVVPHTPISPLHCIAQGDIGGAKVGVVGNLGEAVPLVEWQSKRGWAGVPEALLLKLTQSLKVAVPTPHPDRDFEVGIALGLMEQFLPELAEEAANEYLRARTIVGESEAACADILEQFASSEMIEDVAGRSEKKFCTELVKDAKQSHSRRAAVSSKIEATLLERWPKQKKKRAAKVTKESKALTKVLASGLHDKRWWNLIRGDPGFVLTHAPGRGRLCTDHDNGRFLLTYPDFPRKSVSWTARGPNSASLGCLRWWWQYHLLATGEHPPADLVAMWT